MHVRRRREGRQFELTELTKWTLGDLPDDVLSYVVGAKAASDVAPPQGVGDSWRAPEDYLARDPRGSAEPRRHADNGALEDGVPTLSCPTCGAAKAVDKVRAGITYLACGHHVVVKAAP